MYKEFCNSEKIEYEDIVKMGIKSPIFTKKFIFVYDEGVSNDLLMFCRHVNEEFTLDTYEMSDDHFVLTARGKQFLTADEVLAQLKENYDWEISTFEDERNYV